MAQASSIVGALHFLPIARKVVDGTAKSGPSGIRRDTVVTPQAEIAGDPRFVGHTAALKDLQGFVQERQIPYLGQWYSRIALQYLGVEITVNERVSEWADEGRYLIREVHTHGAHAVDLMEEPDGGLEPSAPLAPRTPCTNDAGVNPISMD
uniref:Uncharacterized protein n=1 Tax=Noctiluca scintillans TaxID=2966 RepID=A0A7S1FDZ3_NOCSC